MPTTPTVNSRPTGFYAPGWHPGVPDYFPAGISFTATEAEMQSMRVRVEGASDGGVITVSDLTVDGHLLYGFEGFFQPIDNTQPNSAKAGQTIPVKWRLTDYLGTPISDPASFVSITTTPSPGACNYAMADAIETFASEPGVAPQYLGDGNWLFNWKTPKGLSGCQTMTLALNDGSTYTAEFLFR